MIFIVLLLLMIGGVVLGYQKYYQGRDDGMPDYSTEKLSKGSISLTVTATGNLEPTNEVSVGSEISGTMKEVLVDYNDTVKEGQVMAVLDTTKLTQQMHSLQASLAVAQANVSLAKATLAESESSLKRLQELHRISGGRTPSQADLDIAVAARDRAQADVASAEASVKKAEAEMKVIQSDLDKSEIKSPINGIVLSRSVEPGQTVAAQFAAPELFVVAESLTKMKLEVSVSEADIGGIKEGQKAKFSVDAWPGRSFEAKVVKVSYASEITDNVVTYESELEVANDDLSLRPGMTATADIQVTERKDVFVVANQALRFNPDAGPKEAGQGSGKSFVESLVARPPRPGKRKNGNAQAGEGGPPPQGPSGEKGGGPMKVIWVFDDGAPRAIPVKTGVTDGRSTEVMGPELKEGMEVIIREKTQTS